MKVTYKPKNKKPETPIGTGAEETVTATLPVSDTTEKSEFEDAKTRMLTRRAQILMPREKRLFRYR